MSHNTYINKRRKHRCVFYVCHKTRVGVSVIKENN